MKEHSGKILDISAHLINTYTCQNCDREKITKKKIPPKLCRICYNKKHKRKEPLKCLVCGKILNPKSAIKTQMCRQCYLKSHSTKFKQRDNNKEFGHWLSGFVDGEGNFGSSKNCGHGCCFRIILREDDKEILEEIKNYLGVGKLYYRDIKAKMDNWNPKYITKVRNNQWGYIVQPIVDLINVIVPQFEEYPLRAKKKKQYEEWRNLILSKKSYSLLKER